MLSRVADTIYWMSRYVERTNYMLQVIRTNYIASQDEVSEFSWKLVLHTYGDMSAEKISSVEKNSKVVLHYLLFDHNNASSVFNNIFKVRENARSIQDHVTKEVWQCLNQYYHLLRDVEIKKQMQSGDPVTVLDQLIRQGLLYAGTADTTMPRGDGFNYMNIGRFIERAVQSTEILKIKIKELDYELVKNAEDPQWRYLLYSLLGYEHYLKTYKGTLQAENVITYILYDNNFPHSILYSLQQLNKYCHRLKSESLSDSYNHLEFLIGKLMNNVKYSVISTNDGNACHDFLIQIKKDLFEIAASLSHHYFGNTNPIY